MACGENMAHSFSQLLYIFFSSNMLGKMNTVYLYMFANNSGMQLKTNLLYFSMEVEHW